MPSATFTALCVLGVALSLYAFIVEKNAERARVSGLTYKAACDINDWISCSKVFNSVYGHLLSYFGLVEKHGPLDVPNCVLGVFAYTGLAVLHFLGAHRIVLLACMALMAMSVWLAYLLAFVLKGLCIVCVATYVLNIVLGIWARRLHRQQAKQKYT